MPKSPFNQDQFNNDRWEWFEAHLTPRIKDKLYFEAFTIVHNQQDAEDALAAARLQAVLKLHQLKKEDRFYAWMVTIVRREARHIKTKTTRNMVAFFHYKNEKVKFTSSPENHVLKQERKEQLLKAVDQLKSPEKEIVILKNWYGMSLLEIAEKLDLNYHTTRSKYTRAMHTLWDMLKKEGGGDSHEKS